MIPSLELKFKINFILTENLAKNYFQIIFKEKINLKLLLIYNILLKIEN